MRHCSIFGFGFAFGASLRVAATGPPWPAELFVVHQNQTIHTNIELSRQSSMKPYGSLAFDLCAVAVKGKKAKKKCVTVWAESTAQYPF